jgi:osmoprotectant transport system ATP-binding protein
MDNRLVEPTEGQVLIDGRDVATEDATALRRRIGYVIQQTGLFPHHTVTQNVATVPRLLGWPAARVGERVDELLALVGLDPGRVRQRYPAELSGGERQRVGVARAMAAEPVVLLMDEPFGAVDPIVRERLQDEMQRLHHTLGTTIIFVTHDVDEAIKLGDRVAVFQVGGRLAQYAPPAELLARPASEFVARFVGSDRALKLLTLLTVGDAHLRDAPHSGGDTPPVVLDWTTTLNDALSAILGSPLGVAVVVDEAGRQQGILTLEAIGAALRAATTSTGGSNAAPLGAVREPLPKAGGLVRQDEPGDAPGSMPPAVGSKP